MYPPAACTCLPLCCSRTLLELPLPFHLTSRLSCRSYHPSLHCLLTLSLLTKALRRARFHTVKNSRRLDSMRSALSGQRAQRRRYEGETGRHSSLSCASWLVAARWLVHKPSSAGEPWTASHTHAPPPCVPPCASPCCSCWCWRLPAASRRGVARSPGSAGAGRARASRRCAVAADRAHGRLPLACSLSPQRSHGTGAA